MAVPCEGMPLHSIYISERITERKLLLAKHNVLVGEQDQALFEAILLDVTKGDDSLGAVYSLTLDDESCVVCQHLGSSLVVMAVGMGDMDELVLGQVTEAVRTIILALLAQAGSRSDGNTAEDSINAQSLLSPNIYGMLSLCLDEMAPDGILDCLDPQSILLAAKLKL